MKEGTRIQSVDSLAVAEIDVKDRLRPVSEAGVAALIASIRTLGVMKDPVQVRRIRHQDGRMVLMAGAHRLEAARRLGWDRLPATLWECNDTWASMMEVDDNLAGAELSPLDTAVFLAERKRLYEQAFPQTKKGGDRKSAEFKGQNQSDIVSFCSATAEKFNLSKRHVERLVAVGEKLDDEALSLLRSAERPTRLTDLQAIAKVSEPSTRQAALERFASGDAKSISDALKQLRPAAPDRSESDKALDALLAAWSTAPMRAKRGFVETIARDLAALLPKDSVS